VEGFSDTNPPPQEHWADNWSLAFARARAAVEIMRHETGRNIVWSARSAGDTGTPFPNDTEINRERNRTVVMHVAERSGPN
jgi:flagellar motor protein MotB